MIARKNDTHEGTCNHNLPCCPHHVTGTIIEASTSVIVEGQGIARVGDKVIHNCPHCGTGYISSGSTKLYVNGKQAASVGDIVKYPNGSGKITSGSDKIEF